MDVGEFEGCSYQRVYQYIQQYMSDGEDLDSFSYSEIAERTPQDCVKTLLK
jgi:hypothetical protein